MIQKKVINKSNTLTQTPEKNITDKVLNQVEALEKNGSIKFPPNYSVSNALKSAWLRLQTVYDKNKNKALDVCTQTSIANSLLDMVVQGLTPAKNQCYFIVYGKELTLSRSYMGTVAVTKRIKEVQDVFANIIFDDDIFQYRINLETGLKEITKHEQDFKNIDITKIAGAYCVVLRETKPTIVEVMNIEQIKKAWMQGVAYSSGKSKSHKNFTDEMAKKTVMNRTCKLIFNTSDDSDLFVGAVNRTTEAEYTQIETVEDVQEAAQIEIEGKANSINIDEAIVENSSEFSEKDKAEIEAKELEESNIKRAF